MQLRSCDNATCPQRSAAGNCSELSSIVGLKSARQLCRIRCRASGLRVAAPSAIVPVATGPRPARPRLDSARRGHDRPTNFEIQSRRSQRPGSQATCAPGSRGRSRQIRPPPGGRQLLGLAVAAAQQNHRLRASKNCKCASAMSAAPGVLPARIRGLPGGEPAGHLLARSRPDELVGSRRARGSSLRQAASRAGQRDEMTGDDIASQRPGRGRGVDRAGPDRQRIVAVSISVNDRGRAASSDRRPGVCSHCAPAVVVMLDGPQQFVARHQRRETAGAPMLGQLRRPGRACSICEIKIQRRGIGAVSWAVRGESSAMRLARRDARRRMRGMHVKPYGSQGPARKQVGRANAAGRMRGG